MVFVAHLLSAAAICATLVSAAPQHNNFVRHEDSPIPDGGPTETSSEVMSVTGSMTTPPAQGGEHHGSSGGHTTKGLEKGKENMVTSSGMDSMGYSGDNKSNIAQATLTLSTSMADTTTTTQTTWTPASSMSDSTTAAYTTWTPASSMSDSTTAAYTTWTPASSMSDSTTAAYTTWTPASSMSDSTTAAYTTWTPASSMGDSTTTTQTTPTPATTWSATSTYSTPAYGSGSYGGSAGGSGYQSCMQVCAASYGAPTMASTWSAPPVATTTAGGSGCTTHTVIVAPTQGVLRYVPFAINASVGDTVAFVWNANNHTVTKSSQLAICNKTADMPFASGEKNKSFVFTQTVNDTNTTFFYCGTPGHCQKGMFGIINPPNAAAGSNGTVSSVMSAMASNSSNMTAMVQYTEMMTAGEPMAAKWGANIDMSSMPESVYQNVLENVMYTRTFLAANPETLSADGRVDLSSAGTTPLMVPKDITVAASNSSTGSSAPPSYGSPTSVAASATITSGPSPSLTGSARNLGSSSILVSFAVISLAFVL